MANATKDFDRWLAVREDTRMTIKIFGRECIVPSELPYQYVLKVERMLKTGESISGETNYALLKQLLSEDDFAYVTGHPEFRMRNVWDIIVFAWLTPDDIEEKTTGFVSEDEVRVKKSRRASKKEPSAR